MRLRKIKIKERARKARHSPKHNHRAYRHHHHKSNKDEHKTDYTTDSTGKKFLLDKVEKYQEELLKKYNKIDELIKELGDKENLIVKLKSDKKIDLLADELDEKEIEINNLREKIEKLTAELEERDKRIERLENIKLHGVDNLRKKLKEKEEKIKEQRHFVNAKSSALREIDNWVDRDKKSVSVEHLKELHEDIENLLTEKRKDGKDVSIQTLEVKRIVPDIQIAETFHDRKKVNFLEKRFNNLREEIEEI